ncbi:hypothetical protein BT67DRAFT_456398 [Trichocladium antarcticum]|uniref:Protein kinase domain-containing protein n=1 Tax=Trichocladium antarcticum TaxID=1450529 RepID=A0AAN6UJL7_9PEZI|nr:hypothetical protein BT67DRAFT_456398 [Trichocladium antarcticum]
MSSMFTRASGRRSPETTPRKTIPPPTITPRKADTPHKERSHRTKEFNPEVEFTPSSQLLRRAKWTAETTTQMQSSFRFGTRIIAATGARADGEHPNVLRLRVHHSTVQAIAQALHRHLPSSLRSWASSLFPEWFLPTNIILKKQKPGWEEEFDTEQATYQRLKCLQGLVIPTYYGQATHNKTRALVLSDIGGACVAEPAGAVLREQDVRPLFDQALGALASQGISHDDLKLDNFHLVDRGGDRAIMVVDLERVNELPPEPDRCARLVRNDVRFLMRAYRDHVECLREDGLLLH